MEKVLEEVYEDSWPVWLYHIFPHHLKNSVIFRKKYVGHELCVLIFSTTFFLEHFSFQEVFNTIFTINAHGSSCKVTVILVRF
jgi:hypothetical protein